MSKKQMTVKQIRNLPQYRNYSEEQLQEVLDKYLYGDSEERAAKIIDSFEEDYDLSGMTANDKLTLYELARIFVLLEDLEESLREAKEEKDWVNFEKINKVANSLRGDASRFQKDLNITRKARQDTGGQLVVNFIEDIKTRAKVFLAERLSEIYCPKCGMLLCKVWFLYPQVHNKLKFVCGRETCGYKFEVDSTEIVRNKNIKVGPPI